MKCVESSMWVTRTVFGAALLLGLLAAVGPANQAIGQGPARNEAELTAQWWQWVLGIPSSDNPLFDETGEDAAVDQPYRGNKVFFLCGVLNVSGSAERTITVPEGTSFYFPLLNLVWGNSAGGGHRMRGGGTDLTVPQMYALLDELINEVDYVYVTVDGEDLTAFAKRVTSPPFTIRLPSDNVFGAPAGVYSPAASDGYWFYLPPLSKGTHTVEFGGSAMDGGFVLDITYHITVE